jgi:leader peptidase (prepilin peptidase)/N-methyltransferase
MPTLSALILPSQPILLLWAFCVGAVLTSFGRLAVQRLPHQLGWRDDAEPGLSLLAPPSRCDGCGARIRWPRLLPLLGWLMARGRCPDCAMRISCWHPLGELAGALGWVLALAWFGPNAQGWAACLLWQAWLFLAEIDWREHWLPAVVTLPLFWAGLLLSPFQASMPARAWGAFTGFAAMGFAMAVASRWRRTEAFAGGDQALCAAAGAWLGLARMPCFLLLTALLFIAGALPARRRGQWRQPMGPALCLAWCLCLLAEGAAWPL